MLFSKSLLPISVATLFASLNIAFTSIILMTATIPATASAATSYKCPGESGYFYTNNRNSRNPRKGGFVSDSANVGDNVFIAPTAAVCGSASVIEYARVYGKAIIGGEAEVTDKARVFGNARVSGTALVGGKAKVSDHAIVSGDTIVEGVAWIRGYFHARSGHFTEGTKRAAKPQSLINAEKKQASAASAQRAKEAANNRKAALKREGKNSLQQISRKLARGSHSVVNYNRQVTYKSSWSVYGINNDKCSIEMKERIRQTGLRSGKKIGKDRTKYRTIKLKYTNLRTENDRDYKPSNCIRYSNEYKFCYNSYSEPGDIIRLIVKHAKKYCSK